MKKYLLVGLFSTLFLTGGSMAYAAEEVPTTPVVTEEIEPSVVVPEVPDATEEQPIIPEITETDPTTPDPVIPDPGGDEPGTPITPDTGEKPIDTTDPGTVTAPVDSTDGSSTEITDPSVPGTTETPTDSSTEDTTPTDTEQPTDPMKEEPAQPVEQPKEDQPAEPAKEVTVSVNPTGEITTDQTPGTIVPIVTSNIDEITHVPTPATPLKAASGQTIVGVQDGVPLVQNNQGNLVKDSSIPVKQLASGNIQVETADGQTKVLPKTGEETRAVLSFLGVFFVALAGFFGYKKRKNRNKLK